MKSFLRLGFVVAFVLLCCATSWGQAATSSVTGLVTDASGASVPEASVTMTQTETGTVRTATTTGDGTYSIPDLPTGPYQLQVKKEGFQTYIQTGIVLQVGTSPTLNAALQVGTVSQEVTVTANAAMVETHSSVLGQVVNQEEVLDIPLNSRDPLQLLTLTPSAVNTGGSGSSGAYTFPTAFVVAFAGTEGSQANYFLDGGQNQAHHSSGPYPLPFPDALQEFNVVTSAVPAQYGGHSSTTVNAIVKSGTNELHGDAFDFVRNGLFNARQYYSGFRDPLKRNQFGGIIGGPIVKDKMFFFYGYQDTILRDRSFGTYHLPTAAELAGDFTAATSAACNNGTKVTLKSSAFPGGTTIINPANFSQPSVNLVSHLPVSTDPTGCGAYSLSYRVATSNPTMVGKVDYKFNDKHSIYGRYFLSDYNLAPDPTTWLTNNHPNQHDKYQTYTMGDTYLISPTIVNSWHGNLNRDVSAKATFEGDLTPSQLGVGGNFYNPVAGYTVANVSGFFDVKSVVAANPLQFNETDFQFMDDVSVSKGSHQLMFGVDFEHQNQDYISTLYINGQFTFTTQTTGYAMSDFLLGDASTFSKGDLITGHMRKNYIAAYAQDSWQVNRKLTVNYGLRWTPYTPTFSSDGRSYFFSFNDYMAGVTSHVYPNAPPGLLFPSPQAGIPGDYKGFGTSYIGDNLHFEPRIGLSYDPSGKGREVIRAAYGVYYDYESLEQRENLQQGPPYGDKTVQNAGRNWTNPWAACPAQSGLTCAPLTSNSLDPYPIPVTFNYQFLAGGAFLSNSELYMKAPMLQQWNLSAQKQFGQTWSVTLAYIGNIGTHNFLSGDENTGEYFPGTATAGGGTGCSFNAAGTGVFDGTSLVDGLKAAGACTTTGNLMYRQRLHVVNPAVPLATESDFGTIILDEPIGLEKYHGGILTVQKRLANNVSFVFNYTYSHCSDDGETGNEGAGQVFRYSEPRNYGSCSWDHRHQWTANALLQSPKFQSKMAAAILGGWKLAPIVSYLSGDWLSVTTGADNAFVGINGGQYANQVANPATPHTTLGGSINPSNGVVTGTLGIHWFATSAFAAPTAPAGFTGNVVVNNGSQGPNLVVGPLGNARKGSILGPSAFNVDLNLTRSFKLNERNSIEIRADAFNVFNIVRYFDPVTTESSTATFGESIITNPTEPGFNQPQDPRIIQLAAKWVF